jgi:hypothetical protein
MAYTTIDDPSAYFQTALYTGDGNAQTITNDGNSDLQPDWVWISMRSHADNRVLFDSVRGVTKRLVSNLNSLEVTVSDMVTAFNSDGFSVGTNTNVTGDGKTFVGWQWKKTADAGFDIVTATGTGSAKTIAHSLSAVPHIIISKEKTGSVNDWTIYHHKNTAAPETDSLILNETNATADQNTHWNDTAPTSSVFTVGSGSVTNRNNSTYVYYLFSEKQGYSKFGGYTGNGNADGAFIYTGFKPAWIMIKQSDGANGWNIYDNKRNTFNVMDKFILANTTAAEASYSVIDFLSNGIKLRNTASSFNTSAKAYVYFAFAESPLVTSTGVPTTAR